MAETVFREYRSSDIPALILLWEDIFSDSREIVSGFFNVLPDIGSCFTAEQDGEIAGMASIITDSRLTVGERSLKCAYIYAVAVKPAFRGAGIGSTLSRMAANHGRKSGADIISTLPANEGLYSMYEKSVGLDRTLRRKKISVPSALPGAAAFPMEPASPAEYNRKREELLSDTAHLSVSDQSIAFLKTLCSGNDGDIYTGQNCCAALYAADDKVFFAELLCPDDDKARLLSLGASLKNRASAYCFTPSETGERYIAYSGEMVYHNPVWNITFE